MNVVLLLALLIGGIAAQSCTLFGVDAESIPMELNTSNLSSFHQLTTISIPYSLWRYSSAFDASTSRFYIVGYNISASTYVLLGVNSENGNLDVQQPLPFAVDAVLNKVFLDFSTSSNGIYLTGPCPDSSSDSCIIRMDPVSGSYVQVAEMGVGAVLLSTYDEQQDVEFLVVGTSTQQALVGVSVANGTLTHKMALGNMTLSNLHFDQATGNLYGISKMSNALDFVQINPQANSISTVASLSGFTSVLQCVSAMSHQANAMFVFLSNSDIPFPNTPYQLVTIDISTGEVIDAVAGCTTSTCPITIVSPM